MDCSNKSTPSAVFAAVLSGLLLLVAQPTAAQLVSVRAQDFQQAQQLKASFHHALTSQVDPLTALYDLSEAEQKWLMARGIPLLPVAKNASVLGAVAVDNSCYPSVLETYSKLQQLVTQYPTLAKLTKLGDSWQQAHGSAGFDLWLLTLSAPQAAPLATKPVLFVQSAIHARELATAALNLAFAEQLLQGYGNDPESTAILERTELQLLVMVNPDGRVIAEQGILKRKNHNTGYCGNNLQSAGIDLNRNFSFGWGQATNGSSSQACAETFRGPVPASEPEVAAIEQHLRATYVDRRGPNRNDAAPDNTSGLHLDLHSYGELVLWPWGDSDVPSGNAEAFAALGRKLAYFNHYYPMQSVGLYPTDGTSESIAYGELGVPSITIEMGTAFFESCQSFINTILPDNLAMLRHAAKLSAAPYQLGAAPDIAQLRLRMDGQQVRASGIATDTQSSLANGKTAQQPITTIEYRKQLPSGEWLAWQSVVASDGAFDASNEPFDTVIEAQLPSTSGRYRYEFRAIDSQGVAGVSQFQQLFAVRGDGDTQHWLLPAELSVTSQCQGKACRLQVPEQSGWQWRWQAMNQPALPIGQTADMQWTLTDTYVQYQLTAQHNSGVSVSQLGYLWAPDNQAPVADFTSSCQDLTCQLSAASSYDSDGSIRHYRWYLGGQVDNSQLLGELQTLSHRFATAGSYAVTLQVEDNLGTTSQVSRNLTVHAPSVTQSAERSGGSVGGLLSVAFMLAMCRRLRPILRKTAL